MDLLGSKALKPLRSCKEVFKPVVAVGTDTIAIDAFERMVDKVRAGSMPVFATASVLLCTSLCAVTSHNAFKQGVYGLAVINEAGKLVDNLSMVGSFLMREIWTHTRTHTHTHTHTLSLSLCSYE